MAVKFEGHHKLRTNKENKRRQEIADFILRRLEALSLSQTALGKRVDLSQPQISRIIRGEHFPRDIAKFAEALELEGEERISFFSIAGYVIESPLSRVADVVAIDRNIAYERLLEAYTGYQNAIYRARVFGGDSQFAIEQASVLTGQIQGALPNAPPIYRAPLLTLLTQTYSELGWAYSAFSHLGELWTNNTSIIKDLFAIAKQYHDSKFSGLAYHFLGDAHYVMGDRTLSIRYLQQALAAEESPDNRLHLHRTMALNWALSGERKVFKKEATKIMELIQTSQASNFERICEAYEGLARAQGYLDLPIAYDTVQEGKSYYIRMESKGEKPPIRYAQLVRAELEIVKRLQPDEFRLIEQIGRVGMNLVIDKAPRLMENIKNLLENSLNQRM